MVPLLNETAWEYIHRIVQNTPVSDECWEWPFARAKGKWEYGWLYSPRPEHKRLGAHSLAFAIYFGHWPKPYGLHRCDNPPCFNPSHIWEGTLRDNTQDMMAKGRNRYILPPRKTGEDHPGAKLNAATVREIIAAYARGDISQYALADRYGVKQSVISRVIARKVWDQVSI
jgi:hypothetical protein